MAVTTSFHMGSTVSFRHNARDPKLCQNEKHINLTEEHLAVGVGVDGVSLRDKYDEIFGEAVREYNEKQKRSDRKIGSYYDKVAKDEKSEKKTSKHLVYEAIMTVGSHRNYNDCFSDEEQIDPQEAKKMLYEAVKEIEEQYGEHIKIVGVYFHNDESRVDIVDGEKVRVRSAPHIHLDYVPVATEYKRGMAVQNAQRRAFEQLGFVKNGKSEAPQIQFNRACREMLDDVVREHGYEISHPIAEKRECEREHLSTYSYKMHKNDEKLNQSECEISRLEKKIESLKWSRNNAEEQKRTALEERDKARSEHDEAIAVGNVMENLKKHDKNELLNLMDTAEKYEDKSGLFGRARTEMFKISPETLEKVKEGIRGLSDGKALYDEINEAREDIRQQAEKSNTNKIEVLENEIEKRTKSYMHERNYAIKERKAIQKKYDALEKECYQLKEDNHQLKEENRSISGEIKRLKSKNDELYRVVSNLKDTVSYYQEEYWKAFKEGFEEARDRAMNFITRTFKFKNPEKAEDKLIDDFQWEHEYITRFYEDDNQERKEAVAMEYMEEYQKHGIQEPNSIFEEFCREVEERKQRQYSYDDWER